MINNLHDIRLAKTVMSKDLSVTIENSHFNNLQKK